SLRNGVVLVGCAKHDRAAIGLASEPDPSAAKLLGSSVVELGLKIAEAPEGLLNKLGNRAAGLAARFGLHDFPEHGVVHVAASIVADSGADVFGHGVQIAKQLFNFL